VFSSAIRNLTPFIQRKVDQKIRLLETNWLHPSLHTKKIKGQEDIWEMRVDQKYRATFEMKGDIIILRVVGDHDKVLRNP